MADDTTTADAVDETTPAETTAPDVEKEAFLERLNKESAKRKEAAQRASTLEKELASLRAQLEERESAGLPELERERKAREKLEERLAEADRRAEEAEQRVMNAQRERWVNAAAQAQNFADPSDASAFLNLSEIEDEKDAERAVKRLAAQKKHLLKNEDPKLPGRVLGNGQVERQNVPGDKAEEEGRMLLDGINAVLQQGFRPAGDL